MMQKVWIGATMVALAWNVPAAAQESSPDDSMSANDIIVTAQKRSERLQDVPIAIDAFSTDSIEAKRLDSIEALARNVPGLTFSDTAGVGLIALRGIGFSVNTGNGENAVAVHRDGIYISPTGASNMLQEDLGSVEVLRGPQGTLYGRNSTGGVINFISKAPPAEWSGDAIVGYGNFDAFRGRASLGGPLNENWRVRISGGFNNRDGFVTNQATGNKIGGVKRRDVALAVDGEIAPGVTTKLRYFYTKENFAGPLYDPYDNSIEVRAPSYGPEEYARDPDLAVQSLDPHSFRQLHVGSAQFDFELAPHLTLRSITGFVKYDHNYLYDGDGTGRNYSSFVERSWNEKDYSQETVLIGDYDRTKFVLGAYLFDGNVRKLSDSLIGFIPTISQITSPFRLNSRSYSIYGDITQEVTDILNIYGGLRWIRDKQKMRYQNILTTPGGTQITACSVDVTMTDEALTGRGGIQLKPSKNFMAYAQYSVGYKSGGFAANCNNPYKPETLKSVELGIKSSPVPGMTLNLAAYLYDYNNQQIAQAIGVNFLIQNTDGRLKGLEASLRYELSDAFTLEASGALIDSHYRNFVNVDQVFPENGPVDLSGRQMMQAPPWSMSLSGNYKVSLAGGDMLELVASMNATDRYKLREFGLGADVQPSFVSGDASITYRQADDRFFVRGWIKNIADERVNSGVVVFPAVASDKPFRLNSLSIGRTYGIEIGTKF